MNNKNLVLKMGLIFFQIYFLNATKLFSQNGDSLFTQTKNYAYNGHYELAIKNIEILIQLHPNNTDYTKFKAAIFAWNNKTDIAIEQIKKIKNYINDIEATNQISQYYFWKKNYDSAYKYIQQAIKLDSLNTTSKQLELDILFASKKYKECYFKTLEEKKPTKKIIEFKYLSANKYFDNKITFGSSTQFENRFQSTLNYLQLQKTIKSITSISQLKVLTRNRTTGIQFQQEAYKPWKKFGYTYGSIAITKSKSFPLLSLSFVHFAPINKNVECDFGIRYYVGQEKNKSYVPSLGITYFNEKMSFHYRYYKVIGEISKGSSHTFYLKKQFNVPEKYFKIDIGFGTQYDIASNAYVQFTIQQKGQNILLTYNTPVTTKISTSIGFMYNNTYINEIEIKKQYIANFSLTYKIANKK